MRRTVLETALLQWRHANDLVSTQKTLPAAHSYLQPSTSNGHGVRRRCMLLVWKNWPSWELVEILEIAAQRKLSTLSTRNRAKHLEGKAGKFRKTGERGTKKAGKPGAALQRNRGNTKAIGGGNKAVGGKRQNAKHGPRGSFQPTNKKVRDLTEKSWNILGHREAMFRPWVVLESGEKQLETLLENSKELFLVEEDRIARQMCFVATKKQKNMDTRGGNMILLQRRKTNILEFHCRTKILRKNKIARSTRKAGRSEKMSCRDSHFGRPPKEKVQVCTSPQPKDWKKAIEMEEGHYLVSRCAMEKSTSEGMKKQFSSSCRLEKTATQKKKQARRFGDIFSNKRQTKKI